MRDNPSDYVLIQELDAELQTLDANLERDRAMGRVKSLGEVTYLSTYLAFASNKTVGLQWR
jgi:hypothetical protein